MLAKTFRLFMILALVLSWFSPGSGHVVQADVTITVNSLLQQGADTTTLCTLGAAIQAANTNAPVDGCTGGSGADAIELPTGTYELTAIAATDETYGPSGLPIVTSDITITGAVDGSGAPTSIISRPDTAPLFRLIQVGSGTLTLNNLKLGGGNAGLTTISQYGGAVLVNSGSFTAINAIFSNNSAYYGGAIDNWGDLSIQGSTFEDNQATSLGGAINQEAGTLTIENSIFNHNTGQGLISNGGAVEIYGDSNFSITGSIFHGNSASYGGAIDSNGTESAVLTVAGSVFDGNTATVAGGAINSPQGTLSVTDSGFTGNSASMGGALFNLTPATISGSLFTGNEATGVAPYIYTWGGGAIASDLVNLSITNSTITGNAAAMETDKGYGEGGGILYYPFTGSGSGNLTLTNVTLAGNSASSGGNLFISSNGSNTTTLYNTIVASPTNGGSCFSVYEGKLLNGEGNLQYGETTATCGSIPVGDPKLQLLADNSSTKKPLTQTMELGEGSAAIGIGILAQCPAADQRGFSSPESMTACDAGAYQSAYIAPAGPTGPSYSVSGLIFWDLDQNGVRDADTEPASFNQWPVSLSSTECTDIPLFQDTARRDGAFAFPWMQATDCHLSLSIYAGDTSYWQTTTIEPFTLQEDKYFEIGFGHLEIRPYDFPWAALNTPYSATFTVTGGVKPFTSLAITGLPDWLSAEYSLADGTITVSGTPTEQDYSAGFTITATDGAGHTMTREGDVWFNVYPMFYTPGMLPEGELNQPYSGSFKVVGGTPPYTLTIYDSFFPMGVDHSFDQTTGLFSLSGTPEEAGAFGMDFKVNDSTGLSIDERGIGFFVKTDLTFTLIANPNPSPAGHPVTLSLSAAGASAYPADGYVTFYADGKEIPGCGEILLLQGRKEADVIDSNPVVCKTDGLRLGDHTITAKFVADQQGSYPPVYKDKAGIAMSGPLTIGDATTYSISGTVIGDTNKNGNIDADDTGIANVVVSLDWGCDGSGQEDDRAISEIGGGYAFHDLQGGLDYCLSVTQAHFKQISGPAQFSSLNGNQTGADFGVMPYDLNIQPYDGYPPIIINRDYSESVTVSGGLEPYTVYETYSFLPTGLSLSTSTADGKLLATISGKAETEAEISGFYHIYVSAVDAHGVPIDLNYGLRLVKPLNLTLHSAINPSGAGQDILLYVTADGYTYDKLPFGPVHFFVDGEEYTTCGGNPSLDITSGTPAGCSILSGLAEGTHTISAVFDDNSGFYGGAIQPLTQTVSSSHKITVNAFNDANGNGVWDDGELSMKDSYIYATIDQGCDGTVEDNPAGFGSLVIENKANGECYRVSVDQQEGWYLTTAQTVDIPAGTEDIAVSFGFKTRVLSIEPALLPAGEVGVQYNQSPIVTGATGTGSVVLVSGTLPGGLSLVDGVISGVPTEAGVFHIRLALQDSASQQVEYWDYNLKIMTDALTLNLSAYPGYVSYSPHAARLVLSATGLPGYPPFGEVTFLDNGSPVPGCEGLMLAEGYIWGPVPFDYNPVICNNAWLEDGFHTISAVFTNQAEGTLSIYKGATITLETPVVIGMGYSPKLLPDGHVGQAYPQAVTVSGGNKPYTFKVGSEDVKAPGLNDYGFNGSAGTITFSGTPSKAGRYNIDVYAYDRDYDFEIGEGMHTEVQAVYWINTDATFEFTTSASSVDPGDPVTFSLGATGDAVNEDGTPWPPMGWVTFYDGDPDNGGVPIENCVNLQLWEGVDEYGNPVDQNPVTCATSTLTAGHHTITAKFTADNPGATGSGGPEIAAFSPYADATLTLTQQVGVDKTPPTITPNITGTLGQNGWYTSSVTLTWTVTDAESEVTSTTSCETVSITTDQAKTDYTCSATSEGGTGSQTVTIGRDTVGPTVTITPSRSSADYNAWYNQFLGFTVTGEDLTSGSVTCEPLPDYSTPDSATASVTGTCTDEAGNTGSKSFGFQYDATPPSITLAADRAPNAGGWYNAALKFTFTRSDATSGVDLSPANCDPDQTYSGPDTDSGVAVGSCMDMAGNTGNSNVINFKYDATKPVVAVTGVTNGATYSSGSVPAAGCNTTDATSGVKTYAALSVTGGDPTSVGSHTATCSGAVDNASNAAAAVSATYTVTAQVSADLSITKTDSKDPIKVGATLIYTLVVTNSGPNTAQTVSVVDTLDKDTTYVSVTAPKGWTCTFNPNIPNNKVTCTTTSLAKGAIVTIKITVTVAKTAKVGASLVNTAQVSSATYDPNIANNSVTQKTTVAK